MSEIERSVSAAFADFLTDLTWPDIPATVQRAALQCLVNVIGATLGGAHDPALTRMIAALRPFFGPPQAVLIGRGERVDRPTAAFVNAAAANALDFDDTHFPTMIHATPLVFPAALAIAEQRKVSGREFLCAFAAGIEIACRMGIGLSPDHYERGAHITTTCGVFGAAAASAKLLALSRGKTAEALGIAANRAAGVVENLSSPAKSIGIGSASRDGLMAALFAEAGLTAAPLAIEGSRGFFAVACRSPAPDAIVAGLGVEWEIERIRCKPYPCGVVLNPVIDGALEIVGHPDFDSAAIERVDVFGSPLLLARTDRIDPANGREAKLSLQHAVAWALAHRSIGIQAFHDDAVAEPAVRALQAKVHAHPSSEYGPDGACVGVTLTDGGILRAEIRAARGSLAVPLSDDEITGKFLDLALWGAPWIDARQLLDTLWGLEKLDDMLSLAALIAPAG